MARIFNVVYLAVMAGAAVYVNAVDYCKMPCNGETHTMCLYKVNIPIISYLVYIVILFIYVAWRDNYCHHVLQSPDPAPACKEPHSLGLTDAEKNIVLKKHNELRKKVASGKEKRGQPGPQPAAVKMPDLVRLKISRNKCDTSSQDTASEEAASCDDIWARYKSC